MSKEKEKAEKIKFGRTDLGKLEKQMAELSSGSFFKAKEGKNFIRILPPINDSGIFYQKETLHYGFKKGGKMVSIRYTGASSPIMEKIKELEEEGPEGIKLAKRLAPKTKYYANIIDRASGRPQVWAFSKTVLKTILSAIKDEDIGDITSLENGHDVVIERTGQNMETRYEVRVRPKPSPAGEIDMALVRKLDELAEDYDDEALEEIIAENFEGAESSNKKKSKSDEDDEDADEDEDEDKPAKKSTLKDEDDEDEETIDEDDEDDEKPAKKKVRPEPEEDDEDEEDKPKKKAKKPEEDEEPVTRRRKSRR